LFCRDLSHHPDLEIAFGHQLLELGVLLLELAEPPHVDRLELPEPLAPGVDRLLAYAVLLGHPGHGAPVRLTQDLDHLLFAEPTLLHGSLPPGSHLLKFQSVRKSQGRSVPIRHPQQLPPFVGRRITVCEGLELRIVVGDLALEAFRQEFIKCSTRPCWQAGESDPA
jgi:hypothetical protein